MNMSHVTITTEAGCSGNPGVGGYAAILRMGDYSKPVSGRNENTTNNRMELMAVISAVKALKKPCVVTVRTKSQYVCNGIAHAKEREQNGWRTKTGARCAHTDLWQELSKLRVEGGHRFAFEHMSTPDNDCKEAEKLVKAQIAGKEI